MRVKETMLEPDIAAYYDPPPIPNRKFDWAAIDVRTYSGDPDEPVGFGETKEDAIKNLLEQLNERQIMRMAW